MTMPNGGALLTVILRYSVTVNLSPPVPSAYRKRRSPVVPESAVDTALNVRQVDEGSSGGRAAQRPGPTSHRQTRAGRPLSVRYWKLSRYGAPGVNSLTRLLTQAEWNRAWSRTAPGLPASGPPEIPAWARLFASEWWQSPTDETGSREAS